MDAQAVSAGSGFDAALKALEDLETDVAQAREGSTPSTATVEMPSSIQAFAPIAPEAVAPEVVASGLAAAVPVTPEPVVVAVDPAVPAAEPVESKVALPAEASAETPIAARAEPSVEDRPLPAISPAAHADTGAASPPVKRSRLPAIAVGLGLFSSIVSAAGLIVVSRTVVSASLVVADARERQQELQKVGVLIHDLEDIRGRQLAMLQRQEAVAEAAPLTAEELDQRLGVLRERLLARDQSREMLDLVRDGQNQLNATLITVGTKVSRIEEKIDGRHK